MNELSQRERLAQGGLTYITVDGAAGEKEHSTDFTVMQVWSTQPDETIALLDAVHDRLNPGQRVDRAMGLYQKWGKYRFQSRTARCGHRRRGEERPARSK